MTDLTLESLADRVQRLERQNRRLRIRWLLSLFIIIGGVASAMTMGALALGNSSSALSAARGETRRAISAQQFALRDEKGYMQAELAAQATGPLLRMWDAKGHPRVILSVHQDTGPELHLSDAKGKARAGLSLGLDGQPRFELTDASGITRVSLCEERHGHPSFTMLDAEGTLHLGWQPLHGMSGYQQAAFSVSGTKSLSTALLGIRQDGRLGFDLLDSEGKTLFSAP